MTDIIKAGMYAEAEDETVDASTVLPSMNKKYTKVTLDNGQQFTVINPEYMDHVERQILELSKLLDIHINRFSKLEIETKRLRTAIKALEKRLS